MGRTGDDQISIKSYLGIFKSISTKYTSFADNNNVFGALFEHLGVKSTYKETRKFAKKFIIEKGKDYYKDSWLKIYDEALDIGVRIVWDKDLDGRLNKLEIWRNNDKKVALPWCEECSFGCKPQSTVINYYEAEDLWKLVGFQMTACDIEVLRQKSALKEIEPLHFSNQSSIAFSFNGSSTLTIDSIYFQLDKLSPLMPKGITKSSSLHNLKAAFGIPYNFDGKNFEVLFGPYLADEKSDRVMATFELNEYQNGIESFSLKHLSGIRKDPSILRNYKLLQTNIGCEDCDKKTYTSYYFTNGYKFYGTFENNLPYEGQVTSTVSSNREPYYSVPNMIERERLANRSEAEVLADQLLASAIAKKEAQSKNNKEYNDHLVDNIASMLGKLRLMVSDYEKFNQEMNLAKKSKDFDRNVHHQKADGHLDAIMKRTEELRAQVYDTRKLIEIFESCQGTGASLDLIRLAGSELIDFRRDSDKKIWTSPYGGIKSHVRIIPDEELEDFMTKHIEEFNSLIETAHNRIISFESLIVSCSKN